MKRIHVVLHEWVFDHVHHFGFAFVLWLVKRAIDVHASDGTVSALCLLAGTIFAAIAGVHGWKETSKLRNGHSPAAAAADAVGFRPEPRPSE